MDAIVRFHGSWLPLKLGPFYRRFHVESRFAVSARRYFATVGGVVCCNRYAFTALRPICRPNNLPGCATLQTLFPVEFSEAAVTLS
jgi:hypothetical protein